LGELGVVRAVAGHEKAGQRPATRSGGRGAAQGADDVRGGTLSDLVRLRYGGCELVRILRLQFLVETIDVDLKARGERGEVGQAGLEPAEHRFGARGAVRRGGKAHRPRG